MRLSPRARAELALAGITILWGSTFILVKSALDDVSTVLFLVLRFSVAALVLVALFFQRINWRYVLPGVGAGGLLFVSYVFQTAGLELTTPSKSAFLTGLSIPMVPLASSLVYRSRPRAFEVAGIVVATLGMALMTLPSEGIAINRGDLLSLLCAVTFALHIVVISHYSPIAGFETIAVVQVVTAAMLGMGSFFLHAPARANLSPRVVIAVLVTGVLATAVAFTTMAWAQQYTSATRSALIFSLEPVVAWVTSWFVLGEILPARARVGAGLILAGVLLVEARSAPRTTAETNDLEETS